MRHHQHTLLQVREIFFQPLHGVEVQVVGGLVEQQVVGMTEQRLGQHHAHLLVVRDVRHLLVVLSLAHAQVLQQLGGLALGLVAVHLGKGHLQLSGFHTVFFRHLWLRIKGLALLHVVPHGLVTHQHGIHHREGVVFEVVLLQHAHALTGQHLHRSFVGLQLTADGAQQRRLARTVGTDNTVNVSTCKLQVHVFIENLFPELDSQICDCNHLFSLYLIYIYINE